MIAGVPTTAQAGTGVQLHARVVRGHGRRRVTWSVNGVQGGHGQLGTITSTGFYRAPATPPSSGRVIIAARTASGTHDRRFVSIVWSAPPGASPGAEGVHSSKQVAVSTEPAPHGTLLAASVTPRHAGEISIRARVGARHLGSCRARTPRESRFTCRLYMPRGLRAGDVRIVAELVRGDAVVARWRRAGS